MAITVPRAKGSTLSVAPGDLMTALNLAQALLAGA